MSTIIDGSNGITTPTYGGTDTSEYLVPVTAFKNRIINGAMQIDQRNAGASTTPTTSGTYNLDRWRIAISQASKFSVQQNAGSVTPPAGFTNYLGVTSLSSYSVLAGDYFSIVQSIEGLNCSDLGWGAVGASAITISFWVRSSLTGTFGGSITNSAYNRSYPFTYAISAANTWEQKTVTIAGDTTGAWLTTTGVGLTVRFGLGVGSTYSGTAGAWTGAGYESATGATSVVGTNGATFYITGVQLEKGSTATSFDYRPYGQELALCQRYCPVIEITAANQSLGTTGQAYSTTHANIPMQLPVTPRTTPTGLTSSGSLGVYDGVGGAAATAITFGGGGISTAFVDVTVASGLTQYRPYYMSGTTAGKIIFTGCEL